MKHNKFDPSRMLWKLRLIQPLCWRQPLWWPDYVTGLKQIRFSVQDGAEVKWQEFTQTYRIRDVVTLYRYILNICDIF